MSRYDTPEEWNDNLMQQCIKSELRGVNMTQELKGSDDNYAIMITVIQEDGSNPSAVYGVYNRETGVREIETRQLQAAYKWVEALSKMTYGTGGIAELPGLEDGDDGSDVPTCADALMKMLVDGDIVVYRCAFAAEHARYVIVDESYGMPVSPIFNSAAERNAWLKENEMSEDCASHTFKEYEPVSHALSNTKHTMNRIAQVGDLHGIFLSKGDCFRSRVATMLKYKGNRDDAPRPKYYDDVREYLIKHYGAVVFTSIEADDALAMCQNDNTVIASIDKDLLQVPGNHYNWEHDANPDKDTDGKVYVSPDVGERKLMMQVLTGDSTDNIPGIVGMGEVTARKALADVPIPELRAACLDIWTEYMINSPKLPIPDMFYDTKDEVVAYIPWSAPLNLNPENWVYSSIEDIMREVYRLVKCGGNDAEKAAHQAGEEVLLPR